jgi:hypothetical protein
MAYPTVDKSKSLQDQLELINPYYSRMRQWIWEQLLVGFPSPGIKVYSNRPKDNPVFKKWAGFTQTSLEAKWLSEGFVRNKFANDEEKKKGVFYRTSGVGPGTTSCNGFVGEVLSLIRNSGVVGNVGANPKNFSSFNIPGLVNASAPSTTPGWHWASEMTDRFKPLPGDIFQAGNQWMGGPRWQVRHVGVILNFKYDPSNSVWESIEAGQGGPSSGWDAITRFAPRNLNPMSKNDNRVFMGWLNIDEFFDSIQLKPHTAAKP